MQAVKRTLRVLSAVAQLGGNGVSLSDLAKETGLSPSTVHRYITVLIEMGYLRRSSTKLLSLGGLSIALGASVYDPDALATRIRSTLESLRAATGETSFVSQLLGTEVLCIAMERGTNPLQLSVRVGQTIPPFHAASARVVLAFAEDSVVEASWERFSSGAADPGGLRRFFAQLETIRERRFDICDSEFDKGVWAVAAPVLSSVTDGMFGAVAVAGAAERFGTEAVRDATLKLVVDAASKLSSQT